MDSIDPHSAIVQLEARIEHLGQVLETCAKFILASRIAIVGGALLFALTLLGVIAFNPTVLIGAIAAMIGGFVLLGSNKSTANEARAALDKAYAHRDALIEIISPRIVGETVH
jgi:hypothetical protein